MRILFVCTGNQCRSPMAAALAQADLDRRGVAAEVTSAGFMGAGQPAPDEVVKAMSAVGIDLSGHRSQPVEPGLLAEADLVVAMARQHLIELSLLSPDNWERCFTFADLLRRAEQVGPRLGGEDLPAWVRRLGRGRARAGLLQLDLADDVDDPMGRRQVAYDRTRDQLAEMVAQLGAAVAPEPAPV
ncbi:MAG: arsenate reductase/protein-tyrosine-phosphatase family protein [Acidimicrobiales bacterium]